MPDVSPPPASPPAWVAALRDQLGVEPVPTDTLTARLRADHPDVAAEQVDTQLRSWPSAHEVDDGWVDLLAAADGAVLTHVLDDPELAAGVLVADDDLDVWARLAAHGLPLAGGGQVRARWFPETSTGADAELVGPDGWLDGYQDGDIVGVWLRDGALAVASMPELPEPDLESVRGLVECGIRLAGAALAAYLHLRDEDDEVTPQVPVGYVAADTLATCPGALRTPLPPLPLLLPAGGLEVDHEGGVSLPGLPEDPEEAANLADEELHGRVTAALFVRACGYGEVPADTEEYAEFLALLALAGVRGYVAELVERDGLPPEVLQRLRSAAGTPAELAVVALLAARVAEGDGEPEQAEELVAEALRQQPDLVPALLDAAEYAATRGDVVAADGYLQRAGLPRDSERRSELAGLVTPPDTGVARNQPCPCGSGRKHKQCCLPHAAHPLPRRATLVYAKLAWWARRAPQREELEAFEDLLGDHPVTPRPDLLALDLALFDAGLVAEYLDVRGGMLPDDERVLLDRWQEAEMAPYEVAHVRSGTGVTLQPLPGGAEVELADRALSTSVRRLDLLAARILHDGQRPCLIAPPCWVPRDRRRQLLAVFDDYQPEQLAAFFGPQPLPALSNREGHELVFSEAAYELAGDPEPAWQRLAAQLSADGSDRLTLLRPVGAEEEVVCGTVWREGSRWTVEANSVERLRELQELVQKAAPDARLVDESIEPARQAMRDRPGEALPAGAPAPDPYGGLPDGMDPAAVQAAMAEFFQRYEQQWLDEQIPALDGLTPRQAAAAGGDALAALQALLDDIEWQDNGTMSADRLRAALGL